MAANLGQLLGSSNQGGWRFDWKDQSIVPKNWGTLLLSVSHFLIVITNVKISTMTIILFFIRRMIFWLLRMLKLQRYCLVSFDRVWNIDRNSIYGCPMETLYNVGSFLTFVIYVFTDGRHNHSFSTWNHINYPNCELR